MIFVNFALLGLAGTALGEELALKQEGEYCGSCFCPPTYTAGECAPGLTCKPDPEYEDLPGICVEDKGTSFCSGFSHRGPCKNQGKDLCEWRQDTCQPSAIWETCAQYSHRGPCKNKGGPQGCAWKVDECLPKTQTRRLSELPCAEFTHRGPCKNQGGPLGCAWVSDKCQFMGPVVGDSFESSEEDKTFVEGPPSGPVGEPEVVHTPVDVCAGFSHRGPCRNQGGPIGCEWRYSDNVCRPTHQRQICTQFTHRGPCRNQGGPLGCVWKYNDNECQPRIENRRLSSDPVVMERLLKISEEN